MDIKQEETIFLVDASSYLYRAYHSIKSLHTPDGVPVNAVYGFCRMVKKLIDTFNPHYIALVWDSKAKTTRHEIYNAYKQTRQAPPNDLFAQKELIVEFADLIGIAQIAQSGVEADDLIYSIAQEQCPRGYTIMVVTSDKDMGQMISPHVFLYDPSKDIIYDAAQFATRMKVPTDKLVLYFSLLGDASDNIPGVHGIGTKTAAALANAYDSLEHIYAHIDTIEPKRARTALLEHKKDAFLSRTLFQLQYHRLDTTADNFAFSRDHWTKATPFFQKLYFKSMITEEPRAVSDKRQYWQQTYHFSIISTEQQLHDLCNHIAQYNALAIDTETNGKAPLEAKLVGISLCVREGEAFYIPCGHTTGETEIPQHVVLAALRPHFENHAIEKYLHNTKFDQKILSTHGIELAGIKYDTAIAASLVVPEGMRVNLKALSTYYFNEDMLNFSDIVTAQKYSTFAEVPHAQAVYYAAADAHQTFKLALLLHKKLINEDLLQLYTTLELPVTQILYRMECTGIYCDITVLEALDHMITKTLAQIENDIYRASGLLVPLNLNSPKQVQYLLFTILKLPSSKKSAGGDLSTRHEVLVELADKHPIPALLLQHRELSKLKNTYVEALPRAVNSRTGRIHTTFNQVGVATGRLSSAEPNLQNIPVDSSMYSGNVRAAFKAKSGYLFLSADYSQIELRVLAYLSQDPHLIEAFNAQHDIHQETAAHIFSVEPSLVTAEQRRVGKKVNFSIIYGVTPFGLARDMRIPLTDAKQYIERYFARYAHVGSWVQEIIAFAQQHGYVQTHWGRKRYIKAIYEKNRVLFQEACRIAVNTVVQGTAAELMKLGMISLNTACTDQNLHAQILLQIHDELLLEVTTEHTAATIEVTRNCLENVVSWNVPLLVTIRTGPDWLTCSK
jgi:DNA polymerase-1